MPYVNDNHFLAEASPPDAAAIKAHLGEANAWYCGILEAASGFETEWKHYGRKYGWKLKAHDGEKTLFELTIGAAGFRIGMAVREAELKTLRDSPGLAAELADLLDPGKSREGWGIRLAVDSETRYRQALGLIGAVAAIRHPAS
jgi:hypothetical protein